MNNEIKKRMIFATGNEGKMKEIRMVLQDMNVEVLSLKEAGITTEIVEDGTTFEENAVIKAKTIMQETGMITLADDSGLEIDYLNKEPGIYSARYLGEKTSYREKNRIIMERLSGVPDELRTARFVCAIAAALPDGQIITTTATIEGRIGYEERGSNGFGYDPIFYVPEFGCTSAELSPEQKNAVSHRGKALNKMKEELVKRGALDCRKILIVSDSHRRNDNLFRVIEKVKPIDLFIHCGDIEGDDQQFEAEAQCPIQVVAGNNDFYYRYERAKVFEIGKYKIYLTHGHHHGVHYGMERLIESGRAAEADIIMFGHTHVPSIQYVKPEDNDGRPMTILNPGSLTYPRQPGRKPSYIIMEIDRMGEAHFTINYLSL